jgi:hypothetical protein
MYLNVGRCEAKIKENTVLLFMVFFCGVPPCINKSGKMAVLKAASKTLLKFSAAQCPQIRHFPSMAKKERWNGSFMSNFSAG